MERSETESNLSVRAAVVYEKSLQYFICQVVASRTPGIMYEFIESGHDDQRDLDVLTLNLGSIQQKFIFDFEMAKIEQRLEEHISPRRALYPSRIFSNTSMISRKLIKIYDRLHKG